MSLRKTLAAALVALLPVAASAQEGAVLTFGLGAALAPEYFGSDNYEIGPTGSLSVQYFSLGGFSFGSPDPGVAREGLSLGGSFRLIGSRDAVDHPELTGLMDVDAALELGLGLTYTGPGYRAFGNLRYGVVGHESLVGEIGADAVVRPNDRLTLTAGPRVFFGSDRYAATYFGITPAEAVASGLPAFAADGGLLSAGVEIGAYYELNDDWGVQGTIGYARLMGDAGDSPITAMGSRTQGRATLMLTRRVTFGF